MLYAIHRGAVEGYTGGQSEVVHLISSAEVVRDAGLAWVFTDGHAEMAPLTEFYDDLRQLDKIDWQLMKERYWHDTNDDPDRKRRRQAEFLVHEFFPWELVSEIGVCDRSAQLIVRKVVGNAAHEPELRVTREWYY